MWHHLRTCFIKVWISNLPSKNGKHICFWSTKQRSPDWPRRLFCDSFLPTAFWRANRCREKQSAVSRNKRRGACRHSLVDSSAPTILLPSFKSQAYHLRFYHLESNLCYICHVKRKKIHKKRFYLGHKKRLKCGRDYYKLTSQDCRVNEAWR